MGGAEKQPDKMGYLFEAVPEEHPTWNNAMEMWWQKGGALLWNQYGGVGSEILRLDSETATRFLQAAALIEGWESQRNNSAGGEPSPLNPLVVRMETADAQGFLPMEPTRAVQQCEGDVVTCCVDCGRDINPALREIWSGDGISLPPRVLNHVLNSLEEAINFARNKGPNNFRTWLAHLEEAADVLKQD